MPLLRISKIASSFIRTNDMVSRVRVLRKKRPSSIHGIPPTPLLAMLTWQRSLMDFFFDGVRSVNIARRGEGGLT